MRKVQPMRGVKPEGPIKFPVIASPKIDGIRALVKDGVVYSKTMKPIRNRKVQEMFGHMHGADGELTVGPPYRQSEDDDVYDRTRGPVMSFDSEETDFRFYVFDCWDRPNTRYEDRMEMITYRFDAHYVHWDYILTQEQLDEIEATTLASGYEGLMLRDPNGPYKFGQATAKEGYLLKLKRFEDAEAEVIAVIEQTTNTNPKKVNELGRSVRSSAKGGKVATGTFGSFLARDLKTGLEFNVGGGKGLTAAKRAELWAIRDQLPGQYITYTFQRIGTKELPRLPQFKGFRDPIDMSDLKEIS